MKHYLLNHQPQKGLQAACAQQGQAPTCNARGKGRTSASPKTLTRILLVLLTMLLLPSAAWGEGTEQQATYTFIGTSLSGTTGTATSNITDETTYNWDIKNFSRTYYGQNTYYTGGSVTPTTTTLGFTVSSSEKITTSFDLVSSEGMTGTFVSATINYTLSNVTAAQVQVLKEDNNSYVPLSYGTGTDEYTALDLSGSSATLLLSESHTENKILNNNKICFSFSFDSNNSNASITINSITITTTETIYLTVAGIPVTSANAGEGKYITGDNISGTNAVQFIPANSSSGTPATLTLNNAEITGDIVWNPSENTDLTINLSGNNTLTGTISTDENISSTVETNLSFTGSTDCSLEIKSESVISGNFKTVNFGNFNLATSSPGAYWDGERMADYSGSGVTNLKITSEVYYPIWVHDYNSSTGYLQLTSDVLSITYDGRHADHPNDKGTISFDTNHTITLDKITYAQGNENAVIVVGPSMSELTVNLDGESSVTNEGPVLCFTGPTNLTFTTSSSGASLSASLFYNNDYKGSVTYENGLVNNNGTISYQAPPITVAGVSPDPEGKFSGISGVTFKPATIGVDQSSSTPATLTLSDANINGGIVWNSGDPLVIALNGENNITTTTDHVICGPSAGSSSYPKLTFAKANGATSCQLTLTHNANDEIYCIYNFTATNTESGLYYIENEPTATVTSTLLGGGIGTSTDPFLIKTAQHLQDFASYVNKGIITNEYIQLNNDIDCSDLAGFETIGFGIPNSTSNTYFKGTFDGNEKSISNLSVKGKGLFYTESNAPIKITKLTLDNLTITGPNGSSGQIGAIASNIYSGDEIEGCVVKNSHITCETSFGNPWMGGIVGANDGGTITNCIVENTEITASVSNSGQSGPTAKAAGIVCNNSGSVSGCQVKGNTIVTASQESTSDVTAGAILCINSGTLSNNTYEYTVKTRTKGSGEADYTVKQNYDQRGLAASNDIIGGAELAGTKKVTISATGLSGDRRTLSLGEMEDTYSLDERDASTEQLTALYVLPGSTVSLVVSSENGYKPVFTLSNSDVEVTPEEKFANGWTIKYEFPMPEDDVTATIAFAKDLESKNSDAFIYTLSAGQEAYPYTGEAIEPSISLTTDPQTPATLTKGTDYEIKDYFEVKEGVATPMYEEDGTTPKAPINVGSYKISITGKGNYFGTRELEFTIAKSAVDWSDNRWVAPEAKTDLKYTGADMELVTAATVPEGVTIKYYAKYSSTAFNSYDYSASQNEEWSEEVPTGKEIGYYAVFYKVEGGDNYLDWGPSEVGIDVNIDKGEVTITTEAQTVTYNAQQQAYTGASADNENVTLAIAYYPSEEERTTGSNALAGAPTDAGTYYVSVTLNEESQQHYTAEPANVTFTIAQLDISEAVITLDKEELTYNGEVQSVTVEKVMAGDIEVPIDCYEVSGNSGTEARNYKLIVTAKLKNSDGSDFKNNFKGSAEKAWKINHRTISADVIAEKFTSEGQTYATFYDASESFLAPQGIVAYIITGVSGSSVTVKAVSYVKAGIPVLLQKTSTSTETEETTDDIFATNILKYAEGDLTANGGQYVLYKNEFVKATGSITSGKCYLDLTGTSFAGTRGFSIAGGAEGTTAISDAVVDSDHSEWFDLQGRKIEKPSKKGLYIRDGKKIVVK